MYWKVKMANSMGFPSNINFLWLFFSNNSIIWDDSIRWDYFRFASLFQDFEQKTRKMKTLGPRQAWSEISFSHGPKRANEANMLLVKPIDVFGCCSKTYSVPFLGARMRRFTNGAENSADFFSFSFFDSFISFHFTSFDANQCHKPVFMRFV